MTERLDDVFGALADPTRRHLLARVAEAGPVTATQLAAELPISRQAVAKHLGVLDSAGLVVPAREGRETRYRATPGTLDDVRSWVDSVGQSWDKRLDALRRHLDERATGS